MASIPVKIYEPAVSKGSATAGGAVGGFAARLVGKTDTIPSEALNSGFKTFLAGIGDALNGVPAVLAGYQVKEIELALEIGTKGEVNLILGSAEMQGKAGVKLKLTKSP
jgi:hypothetical protein